MLLTIRRLSAAWPVLALPFIPVAGQVIGNFILSISLAHIALQ